MSHFGSTNWPNEYGVVDHFAKAYTLVAEAGATEGTSLHTYTAKSSGLYRVNVTIVLTTASTATTTSAITSTIVHTNSGAANTGAIAIGHAPVSFSAKGAVGTTTNWFTVVEVNAAGGTIAVNIVNTVAGTNSTTGAIMWHCTIEKIAEKATG